MKSRDQLVLDLDPLVDKETVARLLGVELASSTASSLRSESPTSRSAAKSDSVIRSSRHTSSPTRYVRILRRCTEHGLTPAASTNPFATPRNRNDLVAYAVCLETTTSEYVQKRDYVCAAFRSGHAVVSAASEP